MYSTILAAFAILAQLWIILALVSFVSKRNISVVEVFRARALLWAWGISLVAAAGSITYSAWFDFAPCVLCWWQRIFLFPLVIILGLALLREERDRIVPYGIVLAAMAGLIGVYNHLLQVTDLPISCLSAEGGVSCAQRYVFEFGYITMPLLSVTASALIVILLLLARKGRRE